MSNRKQELDKAVKESVTPLAVARQVQKQGPTQSVVIVKHTIADALGKAMEQAVRKTFA